MTTRQKFSYSFNKNEILKYVKKKLVSFFGTWIDETYWKLRHIQQPGWAKSYITSLSYSHTHRDQLVKSLEKLEPFKKILEIGCASGPNLYRVALKYPEAQIWGIDISSSAIKTGVKFFKHKGLNLVNLEIGKADDLSRFEDKSFDIVISDAVLIYLGPEKITSAISEMARVARKGIVLIEQHTENKESIYQGRWIHNYSNLFKQMAPHASLTIEEMANVEWTDHWIKYGKIISLKF